MDEGLLIEINGLPDGSVSRHWDLGKEFFALFGNSDIRDARVSADAKMVKSGDSAVVDILLTGSVTVLCGQMLVSFVFRSMVAVLINALRSWFPRRQETLAFLLHCLP